MDLLMEGEGSATQSDFFCDPGYLLRGQSSVTCMCVNGQTMWSHRIPICVHKGQLSYCS